MSFKAIFLLSFFLFLIFFSIFRANFAFALEIKYPKIPGVSTPQQFLKEIEEGIIKKEKALSLYIKYLFYLFLMIGGLLTLGSTIFGGVKYLISGGNVPAMKDARETISSGILGLVILFSSFLIITLINPQLTFFHLSELKKVVFPEIEIPPPTEREPPIYFQVPVGKIIENAIDEEKLNYVKEVAIEAELVSEDLKNLTEDLKKLTEECQCGTSKCGKPPECSKIGCSKVCPEALIEKKVEEIGQAIETLEEKQVLLRLAQDSLLYDFSQLRAVGVLISLASGVVDYNTLLVVKHYQEIEINSFNGWEDIDIEVNSQTVKDPVTFYFYTQGNEEAIYFAETLLWAGDAGPPPEPLPGWPEPPPVEPGKLNWPIAKWPGSFFEDCRGDNCERLHQGIDIFVPRYTPIRAVAAGRVVKVENSPFGDAAGRMITIAHDEIGFSTKYMHNEQNRVKLGDTVEVGQIIATVGNSGNAITTKPHLHFEVWPCVLYPRPMNCRAVDPLRYLPPLQ